MCDPSNAQNEAPNWSSELERTGKSLKSKKGDMWGKCKYPLPPLRSKCGAEALELTRKTDRSAGGLNRRRRKGKGNWLSRRNDVALTKNVEGNETVEAWMENIFFKSNGIMRVGVITDALKWKWKRKEIFLHRRKRKTRNNTILKAK